jgi:hypothetical protein
MLVVTGRSPIKHRRVFWSCRCDCGRTLDVVAGELRAGQKSCGCARAAFIADAKREHGETGARTTPEYRTWKAMRERCHSPNHAMFANYGARGITVCERWGCFENFLADMGRKPSPTHSIDRINNDGNYEPGNCRWATAEEQSRNRRNVYAITIDGKTATLGEWCAVYGVSPATALRRISRGATPEAAVSTPLRHS